ncbi:GntR family transcriptional regulator [Propionivibrio sp.]|uniref:GntR family transcriptional regulator n=1 Tax=Propionivibrio sp. TaxID=2212460 RepID=UPI0039E2A044
MTIDKPLPSSGVMIDDTVARLEELIMRGELQPGDRLPEQQLADTLGVSRGPLREAIRTLEGRRLLERTPHAGVRVVQLSLDDLEQLLAMREALEGMACRQAAEQMTVHEIRGLRETAARIERLIDEGPQPMFSGQLDSDFHLQIAIGSRNQWIRRLLCEDLYSLLRLYRLHAVRQPDNIALVTAREHHAIIDCIHARDPDGAERAMREHVRHSRDRLLAQIRAQG